jgi:hypothetical protein
MLCCDTGWFLYYSVTAFALFAYSTWLPDPIKGTAANELVGDGWMDAVRAGTRAQLCSEVSRPRDANQRKKMFTNRSYITS